MRKRYLEKKIKKNNIKIALKVFYAQKEKYIFCLCFKTTHIIKIELSF